MYELSPRKSASTLLSFSYTDMIIDDVEYIKKETIIFYNTVMFIMITLEESVVKETIKK